MKINKQRKERNARKNRRTKQRDAEKGERQIWMEKGDTDMEKERKRERERAIIEMKFIC